MGYQTPLQCTALVVASEELHEQKEPAPEPTGHLLTGYYNHQNNTVASRTRQAQRRLPAHGKRLEKPR
jgi:hypothetical protein